MEEGTPLWRLHQAGLAPEIDEETSVMLFDVLTERLTAAGYDHYEISNFSLPGMAARHNSGYWDATPYLGCGAAAHSFNGNERQSNVANLMEYIEGIEQGTPHCEKEELSLATRYNDLITTALRTSHGISLSSLRTTFGEEFYAHCLHSARCPLMTKLLEMEGDTLRLTHQGILLANAVMEDLLYV